MTGSRRVPTGSVQYQMEKYGTDSNTKSIDSKD
jgi:hypothetical protein